MLEFQNVTGTKKGFGLKNISFIAEEGYLIGLTGKNGAGKTTLLRYIMEENIAYTGKILLDGKDIRENHAYVRDYVSLVSDEKRFFQDYSAGKNAELLGGFYTSFDSEGFKSAMRRFMVDTGQRLSALSRGEYLKFQTAFAMSHGTRLYLMDEVTGGMDPVFRKDFYKILHELMAEGKATVMLTTHIEEEIDTHMDYVGVMEAGKLISYGEVGKNDGTACRI